MTEKRKPPNAGKGRKRGVPNKATAQAREAISRFIDGNAERLQAWLDEVAEQDGARAAFDCFTALLEFHVPKLARTELTGDADRQQVPSVKIRFVHALSDKSIAK